MSHNNYSKFSNHFNKPVEEVNEMIEETNVNEPTNEVVEDVNLETTEETVVVNNDVEEININTLTAVGTVIGTRRLYVRSQPTKASDPICTIDENSEVQVDLNGTEPENDFYKVVTSEGVEGYCMKQYINIK